MIAYVLRRLFLAVFVVWGVATISFLVTHIDELNGPLNWIRESAPFAGAGFRAQVRDATGVDLSKPFMLGMGDPARIMLGQHQDARTLGEIRRKLGLDDPLWVQYTRFLGGLCRGDLGTSFKTRKPTLEMILDRLPNTLILAVAAILVAVGVGVAAGIVAAVYQDSWIDRMAMGIAVAGLSAPIYLVGLIMILVFVKKLGWIPGVGMEASLSSLVQVRALGWLFEAPLPTYLVLPALALGVRPGSNLARTTRSAMLEVIRQDYVRTARAKGLPETSVVLGHALANAMIPIVTIIGLELAGLLTGAVLTESVFAWPGLGRLTVQALRDLDLPLIQAAVIFIACCFVLANLAVDLLYAWLDPRIRLE